MTRAERLRLVDPPRALGLGDYRAAAGEIEGQLRQLPGFVALHRLGSIGHPGISDLDRIAVVEAADPVPSIWAQLSAGARYAAMHGPFLVDIDTFRSRRWFTHLEGLELIAGDEVAADEPPDPARCDLHLAAEGLALLTLKLVQHAHTGRVKVRSTLCELHALRFSLALAKLDEGEAPEAWRFVHAIRSTRRTWFEHPESDRGANMAWLLERAPAAMLDALGALDRRLGPDVPERREVRLQRPWASVTLVAPGDEHLVPAYGRAVSPAPLSTVIGRSRRASALRWRAAGRRVPMPPRVLGLLSQTREGSTALHRRRHQVIQSYGRFLASRGAGFSHIGLGGPFA